MRAISNGHLYNLRRHAHYRRPRRNYQKTGPTTIPIGERRRPDPKGRLGYLRLDTVHQCDTEKAKGVYYINAVDDDTHQKKLIRRCERAMRKLVGSIARDSSSMNPRLRDLPCCKITL